VTFLLDVNVLIALIDPGHVAHDDAHEWFAAMGQTAPGSVDVRDTVVAIEIQLPGLLGQIASAFKGRLQKAGQLLLTKD
jgi:predicted nucleic acid-binding protein